MYIYPCTRSMYKVDGVGYALQARALSMCIYVYVCIYVCMYIKQARPTSKWKGVMPLFGGGWKFPSAIPNRSKSCKYICISIPVQGRCTRSMALGTGFAGYDPGSPPQTLEEPWHNNIFSIYNFIVFKGFVQHINKWKICGWAQHSG